ncbi:dephospho-CoA kinase [Microbacterium sp. MC2]
MGLTGGIGAGKSTVARALAGFGARVIDGDDAARAVVDPHSKPGAVLLGSIAELLGNRALRPDGSLDRAFVATRIFSDSGVRHEYNALLRPAIIDEVGRRIAAARSTPGIIVHENPLLSRRSAALPWTYDVIVTVEADEKTRVGRLRHGRGYSADEAAARARAQGAEGDRIAVADIVLRTDGTLAQTQAAVADLWLRLSGMRPQR